MKYAHCGKIVKAVARFALWAAAGYVVYRFARPSAVAFRGNASYGGEVLILGMPIYAACVRAILADFTRSRRKEANEE